MTEFTNALYSFEDANADLPSPSSVLLSRDWLESSTNSYTFEFVRNRSTSLADRIIICLMRYHQPQLSSLFDYDIQSVHPRRKIRRTTDLMSAVDRILDPANISEEDILKAMVRYQTHEPMAPKKTIKATFTIKYRRRGVPPKMDPQDLFW